MGSKDFIKVGRGHDAEIRVTDISVSRFHARINRSPEGQYYVEDNNSKFGTLIQIRKPFKLFKNKMNYIQMGRTSLALRVVDPNQEKEEASGGLCQFMCCMKKK